MKKITLMRGMMACLLAFTLTGCGSMGGILGEKTKPAVSEPGDKSKPAKAEPAQTESSSQKPGKGGYYLDDGPGDNPPSDIDAIPDAVPRVESLMARVNRPYSALGESYIPMTEYRPYRAVGVASWYGRRYHGQKTSSGEVYDMYGMSAAHPLLPIPSYVRVTNPENGRSVVVRVNDRGPFKKDRLIDLSYAAAYKLRLVGKGSGDVVVETIDATNDADKVIKPVLSLDKKIDTDAVATDGSFVQVGAFRQKENADQLRDKISRSGFSKNGAVESWYNDGMHRVRIGPYLSRDDAERVAAQLKQSLGLTAIITKQ